VPSEITVIVKDDEKTLRTKSLIYESYTVDEADPILKECIDRTVKEFNGDPTDIQIKISMTVK